MAGKKKLVLLSGPSCVGKGPMRKALHSYYPKIKYAELVLCNSRPPRFKKDTGFYEVHGADFYFLPRGLFAQLDQNRFIIGKVRSDIQAIDMEQVKELFDANNLILAEVFYTLGESLMEWICKQSSLDFEIKSVALVPLTDEEIEKRVKVESKKPEQIIYEVMKAKLEKRGEDSATKIEERALSAYVEIEGMKHYTNHIINHAGEDDRKEWSDPLGPEAQRVLKEFAEILKY
jgi:guanylate kinase